MTSKHTAIKGFTLIEMVISLGIGAVGIAVMGQLFTTTAQQGMKSQSLNTKNSLDDLLSAFLMTSTDCGIALGLRVLNPTTSPSPVPNPFKTDPSVDEPSQLIFAISGLSEESLEAPTLDISPLTVSIYDSLGTKIIAPGLTYRGVQFTAAPSLKLISSSPLNITGQGQYMSYQTRGTLNVVGTRVGTTDPYSFSKVLSINLSIIPSGPDLKTSTFKGKILKCSSLDLATPGSPLINIYALGGSSTSSLEHKVSLPNSTGAPSYLLSVCPFQQYMDNYNADASINCAEARTSGASDTSCTEPGYGYVLIPNANGVLVPTCVLISCPDGQIPTALDSNGFIQSCDLSSNYFIPCKGRENYYNTTSSSGKPIVRTDFYCPATHDKDLRPLPPSQKVCIEDCSAKHYDVCGKMLRDNTYRGPLDPGRLSINCLQGACNTGQCAVPPDCNVQVSNGNFSGYDSGTNTCKSKTTECWGWSVDHNDYAAHTCGQPGSANLYTMDHDKADWHPSTQDCYNDHRGYTFEVTAQPGENRNYTSRVDCKVGGGGWVGQIRHCDSAAYKCHIYVSGTATETCSQSLSYAYCY